MNSTRKQRGADALIAAIAATGTRRIFTLSGNHIMPVFDATIDTGIELVHTRHEAAAVHMADAWARLTGEVGIALVTGGPGHANAVSALYTALMSESAIVLLSGHAPTSQLGDGAFQEMRQADMAAPVTKASWTCESADTIAHDLARAIAIARAGRPGPVHLSLPSDALDEACTQALRCSTSAPSMPEAPTLATIDAQAILAKLAHASRPLILTGPTMLDRQGRDKCRLLAGASGVPVIGMQSPRGVNDPALGAFAPLLAKADLIVMIGKRVDFTLKFGRVPAVDPACRFILIDPDATEIARAARLLDARVSASFQATATQAIDALADASRQGRKAADRDAWYTQVMSAIAWRPPQWRDAVSTRPRRLHPARACGSLQALLDSHPDSVLVCDGGEIGQWAQACLTAPHVIVNGPAGAIGVGVPFAIAASLAKPGAPIVAVMGDGSVGFHIAEFDTAVRMGTAFIAMVGNDARWNAEYQIQLNDYGPKRTIGCELAETRYDRVAAAFGAHGDSIDDPTAMESAIAKARESGLPVCLNVQIEGLAAPVIRQPATD